MGRWSLCVDLHKRSLAAARQKQFPAVLKSILILLPVGAANSYIFAADNVPLFAVFMVIMALSRTGGGIPRHFFPGVTAAFFCFVFYAWIRLDNSSELIISSVSEASGVTHVVEAFLFYVLFVSAAFIYARVGYLSRTLWFLICGYILAFIIRNSFDIAGLQRGYNLSPGFVLFTLLPFAFLPQIKTIPRWFPSAFAVSCAMWLALIGARTATVTILIFLIGLMLWPWISRTWMRYTFTFVFILLGIVGLHLLYFIIATSAVEFVGAEEATFGFFQKRLGTRIEIWAHLTYLISEAPLIGHGTQQATHNVAPVQHLEFTLNRENLSAHSLYFELLYRIGIVGLALFIFLAWTIWQYFWFGRHEWEVQVAGAFLISALFFATTGGYLFFGSLRLHDGFAWVLLGLGAGGCIRVQRQKIHAR